MRIPRFFLKPHSIDRERGVIAIEESTILAQVRNVLRMSPGDRIVVLDGSGSVFHAVIDKLNKHSLVGRIEEEGECGGELPCDVTIALPVLKGGRFEWALQKLTELGVRHLVATVAERSSFRAEGAFQEASALKGSNKLSRWQSIAREAAEQCERAVLPDISGPYLLKELVERDLSKSLASAQLKLICLERATAEPILDVIERGRQARSIAVIIGPEGGFTAREADTCLLKLFEPVTLGQRILRAETAALSVMAVISSVYER